MRINKKLIVGIAAFIVTAAVTFTMFSLNPITNVNADDTKQLKDKIVSTAEEASEIAGFKAALVSKVPDALERLPNYYIHEVKKGVWEIMQLWKMKGHKAIAIGLVQTRYGNLVGAELVPYTYKNISGVRYFASATDGKPGRIDLFWRDGEIGYYLFGNLEGNLDEFAVMEMANSVATNN